MIFLGGVMKVITVKQPFASLIAAVLRSMSLGLGRVNIGGNC